MLAKFVWLLLKKHLTPYLKHFNPRRDLRISWFVVCVVCVVCCLCLFVLFVFVCVVCVVRVLSLSYLFVVDPMLLHRWKGSIVFLNVDVKVEGLKCVILFDLI